MPLVNTRRMLGLAQKERYAVPHFNTTDLEVTQAIISTCVEMRSPVIIGTSTKAIDFAGLDELATLIKTMSKAPIPIALHLDHGPDYEWAKRCIDAGYTSVMIDTSKLDYTKNVGATKKAVSYAHKRNVSVEAEIGVLKGVEDALSVDEKDAYLTNPNMAKRFVSDTKCDSLAIAIGTSHGAFKFKGEPKLDIKRLIEIGEEVSVPLVLHGASSVYQDVTDKINRLGGKISGAKGVPDKVLRKAIENGICKINTDTDLRMAFTLGMRRHIYENPKSYDIREAMESARAEVAKMVERKIKVFGSGGCV